MKKNCLVAPEPVITYLGVLAISETVTSEELIDAGGYGMESMEIKLFIRRGAFTITHRGPRLLYLIHFQENMETHEVEQMVALMSSYELASAGDLLAVGAQLMNGDSQLKLPIICLGSSVEAFGIRRVLGLRLWHEARCLDLRYSIDGLGWEDNCRFLLVSKS